MILLSTNAQGSPENPPRPYLPPCCLSPDYSASALPLNTRRSKSTPSMTAPEADYRGAPTMMLDPHDINLGGDVGSSFGELNPVPC
jgi:hypothetical protein